MRSSSSVSRAVPILLSSVVLLVNVVATILYSLFLLAVMTFPDSTAGNELLPPLFVAGLCATPLSLGSIVVRIARWRFARIVFVLTLLVGLPSAGYFIYLLARYIGHF
jgi:hypothetical protein